MKILYTDYNNITKHVVLQDVMEHAVNKFIQKNIPQYRNVNIMVDTVCISVFITDRIFGPFLLKSYCCVACEA